MYFTISCVVGALIGSFFAARSISTPETRRRKFHTSVAALQDGRKYVLVPTTRHLCFPFVRPYCKETWFPSDALYDAVNERGNVTCVGSYVRKQRGWIVEDQYVNVVEVI